jgi:hypothetical protein
LEINEIQPDLLFIGEVLDFKVKPSRMPFRVTVYPHQQVILEGINQDSQVQVTALEIRVELQIGLLHCRIHPSEEAILEGTNWKYLFFLLKVTKLVFVEFAPIHRKFISIVIFRVKRF